MDFNHALEIGSGEMNEDIKKKLDRIAELEKKHGILGVNFVVKDNCKIPFENCLDFDEQVIKNAATYFAREDDLPTPKDIF